jgi:hypothetical protein
MTSYSHDSWNRRTLAEASVASISPDKSIARTDIALLVSALFLPRFALPFGNTFLQLDVAAIGLILLYQFLSGKLLIRYDRLLWFLGFALAATCSLLLNFNITMLTGYFLFVIFFSLYSFSRPTTADQHKSTLQVFQFLVMLLSCLALVQLAAQFVGEFDRLTHFYGLVPDVLWGPGQAEKYPQTFFRCTGIFLTEPSSLSQFTALGILIEVLEFRRLRYLLVLALGFLLSYGGTGLVLLLLFLPLAGLRHDRAASPALLVVIFAIGLFATGIIDVSHFTSRADELQSSGASGFSRFVAPFYLAAEHFDFEALEALLLGSGPGTVKIFVSTWANTLYTGNFAATWLKVLHEYGVIGSFAFACFLACCLRRSRCPSLVTAAVLFAWVFLQGSMTITIALCTLSGPEPRRARSDGSREYQPSFVAGSAAG